MTELILKIYDSLKRHRLWRIVSLLAVTGVLLMLVARLNYKEDIADFLPVDSQHQNALKVYQDISGGNKVFAIFQYADSSAADPDAMVACIDAFADEVQQVDTAHAVRNLMWQVDLEQMTEVTDFVYSNIPYFLTSADYARIDSLLAQPDFMTRQLGSDKQMLMFPTGSILSDNIQRDPLNLFTPTVQKLQGRQGAMHYEMYEGHIFSPDMQRAIVMMDSPYGSSETEHNAQLIGMLSQCAAKVTAQHHGIECHITGGPVIAVGNASQIKTDSVLSVSISVVLILLLLFVSFRNWRNLLLIAVSIGWGWLFAMGGLALVHNRVSVIVIGISSVILGIAVNYPLHFIAHLEHTPDRRKALREIVMPLLVGNITTVGAFLTLVPLQSVALRDLGLFSSLLLVGTIIFVLMYLPHITRVSAKAARPSFLDRISGFSLDDKPAVVVVVAVLTLVFGYFSLRTEFDSNMSHINYMTDEQSELMSYFQRTMAGDSDVEKVYAITTDSTFDGALDRSRQLQPRLQQLQRSGMVEGYTDCSDFIISRAEQQRRLARWREFVASRGESLKTRLAASAASEGFLADSFDDFLAILDGDYDVHPVDYFNPLLNKVFASNVSTDSASRSYNVVNVLNVKPGSVGTVETSLDSADCYSFDVASLNGAIASHLSDDFNYIGFACGFIVFFFLWLSLGSIELALLSFVPMAVSWLWILGIMALLGMQFNIVNIILATFIFGQGDDYTIFMTEGASYEYAYRRKMLASYKHSIIISALIMFIGIGTLIVARHPALRSLAEVTIAGMFSVVLMAYIFPPLIFRFLVATGNGGYRTRPATLASVLRTACFRLELWMRLAACRHVGLACGKAVRHIMGVDCRIGSRVDGPVVLAANCCSQLDVLLLMSLGTDVTVVCSAESRIKLLPAWLGKRGVRYALTGNDDADFAFLAQRVAEGRSLAVIDFGRGTDLAARIAGSLNVPLRGVALQGTELVMPDGGTMAHSGTVEVALLPAIKPSGDADDFAAAVCESIQQKETAMAQRVASAAYFSALVLDRYRYKGAEIYSAVKRSLKANANFTAVVDKADSQLARLIILNQGNGEMAILYALVHPQCEVLVVEANAELRDLIRYSAQGIAPNVTVIDDDAKIEKIKQLWENQ